MTVSEMIEKLREFSPDARLIVGTRIIREGVKGAETVVCSKLSAQKSRAGDRVIIYGDWHQTKEQTAFFKRLKARP